MASKPSEILAQQLVNLRTTQKLTQQELALELQVIQPVISDWEQGRTKISVDILVQLAQFFGKSTDELLCLKKSTHDQSAIKNRRLLYRLEKIDQLPDKVQNALIIIIDRMSTHIEE